MDAEIKLSTGKLCPRCGSQSLEEEYSTNTVKFQNNYSCIAMCGMEFALNRLKSGKISIYYNPENEIYLKRRFGFK